MNAASILTTLWPHSTAKHFAQAAGCSPRQAKRILFTGRVPVRLQPIFLKATDQEIEKTRRDMDALQKELRAIVLQEVADRAASRAAQNQAPDPALDPGQAHRAITTESIGED